MQDKSVGVRKQYGTVPAVILAVSLRNYCRLQECQPALCSGPEKEVGEAALKTSVLCVLWPLPCHSLSSKVFNSNVYNVTTILKLRL